MTVNELIQNFRINVDNGGIMLVENNTSKFCNLTENMLDVIGNEKVLSTDMFHGRIFIRINTSIDMLRTV